MFSSQRIMPPGQIFIHNYEVIRKGIWYFTPTMSPIGRLTLEQCLLSKKKIISVNISLRQVLFLYIKGEVTFVELQREGMQKIECICTVRSQIIVIKKDELVQQIKSNYEIIIHLACWVSCDPEWLLSFEFLSMFR